ncbi:capsular biosynthesis protein [Anaerobacillus arseniciselenatis]|uniref:Capsular biosynthesis protein n=2 Tax=Anaerobacillus arseniciselenatis TaxID=85682 RepID=A0A1S2LKF1_9BACI|nr:capsular biosynthesis protein [Anaerobacillus arseniciselenatis]
MNFFKKSILTVILFLLLGTSFSFAEEAIYIDNSPFVGGKTYGASEPNNQEQVNFLTKIRKGRQMVALHVEEVFAGKFVEPEVVSITISAAGDVTLGGDDRYGYEGSFNQEAKREGLGHFVENIKDLFSKDDLTMVNLEGALTNATARKDKQFTFRGDPSYTEILTNGNIDVVNLANNHTLDFFQKGYEDTINHLKDAGVGYFGFENHLMTEIKEVKIGLLGYTGWYDSTTLRNQIKKDIDNLREEGAKIVIVNFHWGQERSYVPNQTQKSLGRYTIDSGADLVVGHRPHVIQGIEEYNGKFIVYSLANFMFGGNRNPSDKDTFVFQQTFHLIDGELTDEKEVKVIPFSVSSVSHRNNFQPTPLIGDEAKRVRQKIIDLSLDLNETNWVQYEK